MHFRLIGFIIAFVALLVYVLLKMRRSKDPANIKPASPAKLNKKKEEPKGEPKKEEPKQEKRPEPVKHNSKFITVAIPYLGCR